MPARGLAFRLAVAVLAAPALVLSSTATGGSRPGASTVASEDAAAGAAYRVPASLLEAIGYVNTRWTMPRTPSPDGGRGPMHLLPARLREAAWLTGIPVQRIATDRGANLRGGAAVLARL